MRGTCKLCNKNKELIRSHLIPEGFYKNTYDQKGRAIYASKLRNKTNYIQKGYRENLLCYNCDSNIIGKNEKYSIEVIRDRKHIKQKVYSNCLLWDGLNYEKFKLFHLSILWRLHIAQENTNGVILSESIANAIHQYILSETAPDAYTFPIFGLYLFDQYDSSNNCDEIITYGNFYKLPLANESNVLVVIYGGIAWNYIVPDAKGNNYYEHLFLKEARPLKLQYENIRAFQPFLDVYGSVDLAARFKSNTT